MIDIMEGSPISSTTPTRTMILQQWKRIMKRSSMSCPARSSRWTRSISVRSSRWNCKPLPSHGTAFQQNERLFLIPRLCSRLWIGDSLSYFVICYTYPSSMVRGMTFTDTAFCTKKLYGDRSTVIGLHITSKKPVEAKNYKCLSTWHNALTYLLEIEFGLQNNKTTHNRTLSHILQLLCIVMSAALFDAFHLVRFASPKRWKCTISRARRNLMASLTSGSSDRRRMLS